MPPGSSCLTAIGRGSTLRQLAAFEKTYGYVIVRPSRTSTSNDSPLRLRLKIVVAPSPFRQARFQSTASTGGNDGQNKQPPPPPPRIPPGRLLARLVGGSFRTLGNVFRPSSLRLLYRSNPEELIVALVILAVLAAIGVYIVRVYFTYFYAEQFTRYPAPIAKSLRRALYYSNYQLDTKLALKYYKIALEQCDEFRLDPFSDDVLGIKIQLAAWLEKIGSYENAIQVLERVLGDCKQWVDVMEKGVKSGNIPKSLMPPPPILEPGSGAQGSPKDVPEETLWGKRTRVLAKAVGISVKLGELYADEHIRDQELAHERLTWAVETALKELQRRAAGPLKEGEGEWMNSEQMGAALESLAHSYERKDQFHLALPLFFQALRLSQNQCHSAVIMNNLAVAFAQHPAQIPVEDLLNMNPDGSASPPNSKKLAAPGAHRAAYLDAARRWAANAQQHASEPQGDQRSPECDEACAVSLCNLGDIARLSGDLSEARRRFEQAVATSREVGFAAGMARAEDGLRSLGGEQTSK